MPSPWWGNTMVQLMPRKAKNETVPIMVTSRAPTVLLRVLNRATATPPPEFSMNRVANWRSRMVATPSIAMDGPIPADMAATSRIHG